MLAGGVVFALHGTSWPLLGQGGDNIRLIAWTDDVLRTGRFHNVYPPGVPRLAAWIARYAEHDDANAALKPLFLTASALVAPAGYLAWRTVLPPLTALAVALAGAYALNAPEKPYPLLVLVMVVPLLAKAVQWLRLSPGFGRAGAFARGAGLGLPFGLLFLLYAGQHVWSFPAFAVLLPAALPWRAGRAGLLRAALLLAGLAAGFLAVGGAYLRQLQGAAGTHDTYCSAWTLADPAAVGVFPLTAGPWPLLLAGAGTAIALGLRTPAVSAALACFGGAWLLRFYLAHRMARDADVHLFTHTEAEVQYTLVVLTVLGASLAVRELVRHWGGGPGSGSPGGGGPAGAVAARGAVGLLFGALLFCGVAGSAATDAVLAVHPVPGRAVLGNAAWIAQHLRNPGGSCSRYAVGGRCVTAPRRPVPPPFDTTGRLRCPDFGFSSRPPAG
jgi:galactan 5-O-arabinofuranosyltransferase